MHTPTLGEVLAAAQDFDTRKEDYMGSEYAFAVTSEVEIAPFDKLTGAPLQPLPMTDHALGQFVGRVGTVTPTVARGLRDNEGTRPHLGRALNVLLEQHEAKPRTAPLQIRAYEGRARAVLSTQYKDTPNTELLKAAARGIEEFGAQNKMAIDIVNFPLDRTTLTPDKLYLYSGLSVINAAPGGPYRLGFAAKNSEIGDGALELFPYIQRGPCTNTWVIDNNSAFYTRHRGSGLIVAFTAAIGNALHLAYQGFERLVNSQAIEIPNVHKEIEKLAEAHGWDAEVIGAVGVGTEGHQSVFGVTNGITFAAHTLFPNDAEKRFEMERVGGQYLLTHTPEPNGSDS